MVSEKGEKEAGNSDQDQRVVMLMSQVNGESHLSLELSDSLIIKCFITSDFLPEQR